MATMRFPIWAFFALILLLAVLAFLGSATVTDAQIAGGVEMNPRVETLAMREFWIGRVKRQWTPDIPRIPFPRVPDVPRIPTPF